ncbi:MAG TPA: hypothetical protein VN441_11890 [Syntrophomonas sp.]|nr:hypothetical protein [Syntrophomonas sp.]
MKLHDLYGNVMMEVTSVDRKDDDLVMKGKMMGTMPATIYLRPDEMWKAMNLLTWAIIRYVPSMLIKGWRQSRSKK